MQGEKRRDDGHTIIVPVSQWEIDTVREDLIARIEGQKEFLKALIDANDRLATEKGADAKQALKVALEATNERLVLLNEFRKQSADRDQGFMARSEAIAKFDMISGLLSACLVRSEAIAKFEALTIQQDVTRERVTKIESATGGAQQSWSGILSAVSAIASVGAIIIAVIAIIGTARVPQPVIGVDPPPVRVAPQP